MHNFSHIFQKIIFVLIVFVPQMEQSSSALIARKMFFVENIGRRPYSLNIQTLHRQVLESGFKDAGRKHLVNVCQILRGGVGDDDECSSNDDVSDADSSGWDFFCVSCVSDACKSAVDTSFMRDSTVVARC